MHLHGCKAFCHPFPYLHAAFQFAYVQLRDLHGLDHGV